jgi:hypothetical protein
VLFTIHLILFVVHGPLAAILICWLLQGHHLLIVFAPLITEYAVVGVDVVLLASLEVLCAWPRPGLGLLREHLFGRGIGTLVRLDEDLYRSLSDLGTVCVAAESPRAAIYDARAEHGSNGSDSSMLYGVRRATLKRSIPQDSLRLWSSHGDSRRQPEGWVRFVPVDG